MGERYSWARAEAPHGMETYDLARGGTPIGTLTIKGTLPNPSLVLGPLCDALAGPAVKPDTPHGQPADEPQTDPQRALLHILLAELGYDTPGSRHRKLTRFLGREIASSNDLTKAEASFVIDAAQTAVNRQRALGKGGLTGGTRHDDLGSSA